MGRMLKDFTAAHSHIVCIYHISWSETTKHSLDRKGEIVKETGCGKSV